MHSLCTNATVIEQARTLEGSVNTAAIIAEVKITAIRERTFSKSGEPFPCGTDFSVDVLEQLKGPRQSELTFSIIGQPHPMFEHYVKPGDELLVLLVPRAIHDAPEGEAADIIRGEPSQAELNCRETLAAHTLLGGDKGGFIVINRSARTRTDTEFVKWLVYTQSRTVMATQLKRYEIFYKQGCTEENCWRDGRRMVPWEAAKSEIIRWVRANQ